MDRLWIVGLVREPLTVDPGGVLQASETGVGIAQHLAGAGVTGLAAEGLRGLLQRLLGPAHPDVETGQVVSGVDEVRRQLDGLEQGALGLLQAPQGLAQDAVVVERVGTLGVQSERLAILPLRVLEALVVEQEVAEIAVESGVIRNQLHRAGDEPQRILASPLVVRQHAHEMERVGVLGRQVEHALVQRLGLVCMACPMQGRRQPQRVWDGEGLAQVDVEIVWLHVLGFLATRSSIRCLWRPPLGQKAAPPDPSVCCEVWWAATRPAALGSSVRHPFMESPSA